MYSYDMCVAFCVCYFTEHDGFKAYPSSNLLSDSLLFVAKYYSIVWLLPHFI